MKNKRPPPSPPVPMRVEGIHIAQAFTTAKREAAMRAFAARLQASASAMIEEGRIVQISVVEGMGAVVIGRRLEESPRPVAPQESPPPTSAPSDEDADQEARVVIHPFTGRLIQNCVIAAQSIPPFIGPVLRRKHISRALQQLTEGMTGDMLHCAAADITSILAAKKAHAKSGPADALLLEMRDLLVERAKQSLH